MISSAVSATSISRTLQIIKTKTLFLFVCSLVLSGCLRFYHVKDNLSEGQVIEPAIIRNPTHEKSWGILPIYEDYLEGYIQGGVMGPDGHPIQGVTVKVLSDKGKELDSYQPGVTDGSGIYKIRFSLPIHWKILDTKGVLSVNSEWQMKTPQTQFRLYFSQSNGILAFTSKEYWLTVQAGEAVPEKNKPGAFSIKKPEKPEAPKKKGDDLFGNFGFGP